MLGGSGIRLVHEPVAALTVEDDRLTGVRLTGVRLEGGGTVVVAALFISPEVIATRSCRTSAPASRPSRWGAA